MKTSAALLASGMMFLAGAVKSQAALFLIDLSPVTGTALNMGAPVTHYFGDHSVGLAAPNETAPPASLATGNEIGGGITFDSVSKVLSFHVGYGSALGFTDMVGVFTDAHFHGPGPVMFPAPNVSAGVIIPVGATHAPAGPGSGTLFGSVILSPADEGMLFDNAIYLNIHSTFAPGGEIRGQLVVVPEPATAALILLGAVALPLRRRR
jgi:hypothetical protein